MRKILYRSSTDCMIGGVCGGLAEYFNIDPVIIRIVWAVAVCCYGTGLLLYLLFWIITPKNKI